MDTRYSAPQAPVADAPWEELGWSTFSHSRRIGIAACVLALLFQFVMVTIVAMKGRLEFYLVIYSCIYISASALGLVSLWPFRQRVAVTAVSILVNGLLLTLGAVATCIYFMPALLPGFRMAMSPGRTAFTVVMMVLLPGACVFANCVAWRRRRKLPNASG